MVVHFTPQKRTLVKSSDRPAGLGGRVAIAKDAIQRGQEAQCGCGGQSPTNRKQALAQFAQKVQGDPVLTRKLGRRVYELMRADLDLQRERNWNYGARYGWTQN
ncbi:MAG: hypothetical protein F6J87_30370 [Spirulina sp. SIO3F2]|nr:hypothetical protein [Spirulina sp. SIO3F2]